jgi:hypothetical protein
MPSDWRTFALRTLAAAVVAAGAAACASRQPADSSVNASAAPATRRDVLERTEIDRGQWPNAYEAIRGLRPQWLRVRGRDTITGDPGTVQVLLDDVRLGGPESLRTLPISGIAYIQFLDGITASQRWGTGYGNGAIFISTRPR